MPSNTLFSSRVPWASCTAPRRRIDRNRWGSRFSFLAKVSRGCVATVRPGALSSDSFVFRVGAGGWRPKKKRCMEAPRPAAGRDGAADSWTLEHLLEDVGLGGQGETFNVDVKSFSLIRRSRFPFLSRVPSVFNSTALTM